MSVSPKTIRYGFQTAQLNAHFTSVLRYTAMGGAWADYTTSAGNATTNDVPFASAINDIMYFGDPYQFKQYFIAMASGASGRTAVNSEWEYSLGGSAWAAFTPIAYTGNIWLTTSASHGMYLTIPADWATDTVNGLTMYWIRLRNKAGGITVGSGSFATCGKYVPLAGVGGSTIDISDVLNRTILSAYVNLDVHMNYFGRMVACRSRFDAGAWTEYNAIGAANQQAIVTDGEFKFALDVTSVVATRFNGSPDASALFEFEFSYAPSLVFAMTPVTSNNIMFYTGELVITYEADDAAPTKMNTIMIPLDSISGSLTNVLQNIGGADGIPQITGVGGFIKEASPVIKDLYIVLSGNNNSKSATITTLTSMYCKLVDDAGEILLHKIRNAQYLTCYMYGAIWSRKTLDTTIAHTLQLRLSAATYMDFQDIGAYVVVTYSYDDTTTTEITVSVQVPFMCPNGPEYPIDVAAPVVKLLNFIVPDASPTLLTSGIQFYHTIQYVDGTHKLSVGAQAYRTYNLGFCGTTKVNAGPNPIIHRLDAGAAAGVGGLTLIQGKNTLSVRSYLAVTGSTASTSCGSNPCILMLNYSATKVAGKRMCSLWEMLAPIDFEYGYILATKINKTFTMSSADHFYNSLSVCNTSPAYSHGTIRCGVYVNALTGVTKCISPLYAASAPGSPDTIDISDAFLRYPEDLDADRISVSAAWEWWYFGPARRGGVLCRFYHNFNFDVTGTISGSAGGIVYLQLVNATTDKVISETSIVGNGAFTLANYYPTDNLYVAAYESDTKKGSSKRAVYGSGFDVNLAGGGSGGGAFSYGYAG